MCLTGLFDTFANRLQRPAPDTAVPTDRPEIFRIAFRVGARESEEVRNQNVDYFFLHLGMNVRALKEFSFAGIPKPAASGFSFGVIVRSQGKETFKVLPAQYPDELVLCRLHPGADFPARERPKFEGILTNVAIEHALQEPGLRVVRIRELLFHKARSTINHGFDIGESRREFWKCSLQPGHP